MSGLFFLQSEKDLKQLQRKIQLHLFNNIFGTKKLYLQETQLESSGQFECYLIWKSTDNSAIREIEIIVKCQMKILDWLMFIQKTVMNRNDRSTKAIFPPKKLNL